MCVLIGAALGVLVIGGLTPSWAKEFLLKIGDLQVPTGTAVHGDAIALGGTAVVNGTVEGDVAALGGDVRVRGHVTGSVRAEGGNVVLYSTAVVDGEATAVGGKVQQEPGASVGGRRSAPPSPTFPPVSVPGSPAPGEPLPPSPWLPGLFASVFLMLKSLYWLVHLVVLVVFVGTSWSLAALFPRAITRLAAVLDRDPVMALGAGLLGWPIAVMVAVLLIISVVGLTLVLLVPVALFTAVQFGTTAVALVVGRRIRPSAVVQEVLVGAVILAVVFSIPGLGGLAALAVATWGLGAVLLMFVEQRRFRQPPPAPQAPSPQQSPGGTAAS
jgi:magnesium-transporting ATPase (P-type)